MNWYVLRSKPNKEALLSEQLSIRDVEVFHPQIRVQPVNPRARKVKPYFPGYVFVRLHEDQIGFAALQWMPGAVGIVSFDNQPSIVPDALIHAIQARVDEINAAGGEVLHDLKHGDLVRIQSGPFAGHEAIFDARLPGRERARVLLELLSKQYLPLDVPAENLEKKQK